MNKVTLPSFNNQEASILLPAVSQGMSFSYKFSLTFKGFIEDEMIWLVMTCVVISK
jgi:hypothetical protein